MTCHKYATDKALDHFINMSNRQKPWRVIDKCDYSWQPKLWQFFFAVYESPFLCPVANSIKNFWNCSTCTCVTSFWRPAMMVGSSSTWLSWYPAIRLFRRSIGRSFWSFSPSVQWSTGPRLRCQSHCQAFQFTFMSRSLIAAQIEMKSWHNQHAPATMPPAAQIPTYN